MKIASLKSAAVAFAMIIASLFALTVADVPMVAADTIAQEICPSPGVVVSVGDRAVSHTNAFAGIQVFGNVGALPVDGGCA